MEQSTQVNNTFRKDLLFSVLVANYNNGQYLMEAIDSVRQQTYSNWEIIIVDDCSSDISGDIYDSLQTDKRIHIYRNNKNYGCGYTKRCCVDKAMGDICGFLDPDDKLAINALAVMVDEHIRHPEVSLVYSTYYQCNEQMQVEKVNKSTRIIPKNTDYLHYQRGAVHAFASFKRNKYMLSDGINATYLRAVDQDLYYKMEEQGELLFHDEPLYYYRFHVGSISIFANAFKARYWHIIAIHDACVRRAIFSDAEDIVSELLKINIGDVETLQAALLRYQRPTLRTVCRVFKRWIKYRI